MAVLSFPEIWTCMRACRLAGPVWLCSGKKKSVFQKIIKDFSPSVMFSFSIVAYSILIIGECGCLRLNPSKPSNWSSLWVHTSNPSTGLVPESSSQMEKEGEVLGPQQRDGWIWAVWGHGASLHSSSRVYTEVCQGWNYGFLCPLATRYINNPC